MEPEEKAQDATETDSPEKEWDREYEAAWDTSAADDKAKADAGSDQPEEQEAAGEVPASGEKTETAGTEEREKQAELEFLRALGLEGEQVSPGELTRIKKVHGKLKSVIDGQAGTIKLYGGQLHEMKQKLQSLRTEQATAAAMRPISPDDVAKFREANKAWIAALPPGARGLYDDDDYVAIEIAKDRRSAASRPDAPVEVPPAPEQASDVSQLEPEQREQAQATAQEITKAGFGNFVEVYASPEFREYMGARMAHEMQLLGLPMSEEGYRSTPTYRMIRNFQNPAGHIAILHHYNTMRQIKADEQKASAETQKRNDALRPHGGGRHVRPSEGDGWKDPMDMTQEEAQRFFNQIERTVVQPR